jgi:hypothetical protein
MDDTQLLCSFVEVDGIDDMIQNIISSYQLIFNKIYVLENIEDVNQLILTYNVLKNSVIMPPPPSTISVHRKKQTNTIYTINAINKLIEQKNNGILDKKYRIDWSELQNTILVTAYSHLKIVHTKLNRIINV